MYSFLINLKPLDITFNCPHEEIVGNKYEVWQAESWDLKLRFETGCSGKLVMGKVPKETSKGIIEHVIYQKKVPHDGIFARNFSLFLTVFF